MALNYALRCPYFTLREQIVKLISISQKKTTEEAKLLKMSGGIKLSYMKNFAVHNQQSYSLSKAPIESFDLAIIQDR
jgi:hypothetical protein